MDLEEEKPEFQTEGTFLNFFFILTKLIAHAPVLDFLECSNSYLSEPELSLQFHIANILRKITISQITRGMYFVFCTVQELSD